MKDPQRDPAVRAVLTRAERPSRAAKVRGIDHAALGARVKRAASYDLFKRRHPIASPADYIAQWSRALLPIGFLCTFAGLVILLQPHAFARDPAGADDAALISAATNRITTPQLVDLVLRQVDEFPSAPVRTHK